MTEQLRCVLCRQTYPVGEVRYECDCHGLLAVEHPPAAWQGVDTELFDSRQRGSAEIDLSGVWRFREVVRALPPAAIITHPEGATRLYARAALCRYAGLESLHFKHEGENPTGSFKDRGMTVATSQAVAQGATAVACASTGNTSAALAAYAARAGLQALVFLPAGKVALGKMAQTLAYGARCFAVRGDFDAAMRLVTDVCRTLGVHLLNSKNPFRIEGQKTIVWEILQNLAWDPPDWIAVPAGNLGNTSAFGKAIEEAVAAGWIKRAPRLLAVQATGANPFYLSYAAGFRTRHRVQADTIATAIRIGDPVSFDKARAAIEYTRGVVTEVTDPELMAAKRMIDQSGLGCEPASACSLAGVRKMVAAGVIARGERVVCVLTGNLMKDPDAVLEELPGVASVAKPVEIEPTLDAVRALLAPGGRPG
ncbi:MAG: threonine synthase [Deltaproteobacteria bacterium]|nr:threonine synthase [Deltaproteobacteria bacterium]